MLVIERTVGSSFYVGDQQVIIEEIMSPSRFKVKVVGSWLSGMDQLFEVRNNVQTEIMPEVFLQAGNDDAEGNQYAVKVCIDAPRRMTILRDTLYDRAQSRNS